MKNHKILGNLDQILLAYKRLGHKVCDMSNENAENVHLNLLNALSSPSSQFQRDLEEMNAESSKRYRPNEHLLAELMQERSSQTGEAESKGSNTPPEMSLDEFSISMDRAREHFHHPFFHIERRGYQESKSPNSEIYSASSLSSASSSDLKQFQDLMLAQSGPMRFAPLCGDELESIHFDTSYLQNISKSSSYQSFKSQDSESSSPTGTSSISSRSSSRRSRKCSRTSSITSESEVPVPKRMCVA